LSRTIAGLAVSLLFWYSKGAILNLNSLKQKILPNISVKRPTCCRKGRETNSRNAVHVKCMSVLYYRKLQSNSMYLPKSPMFVSVPPAVFSIRLSFVVKFFLKMVVFPHKVSHTHSGCLVITLRRESWILLQSLGNGVMSTVTFCTLTASLLCCSGAILKNPSVTSRSCNIRFADNLQVWESDITLSLRTYSRNVCRFYMELIERMLDVKNVRQFY